VFALKAFGIVDINESVTFPRHQTLMPSSRNPTRRWMAFSLRGMLLVITLAAVWMGYLTNRAVQQRRAVAAIKQLGGEVAYDWEFAKPDRRRSWPNNVEPHPPGSRWLRKLVGDEYFQRVREIDLHNRDSELPRAGIGLPSLSGLSHVREIDITGFELSTKQLSFLASMNELEELHLDECVLTGNALVHLRPDRLIDLKMETCQITPAALQEIGRCTLLEELSLDDTTVDAQQMGWLAPLKQLRSLALSNTGTTDAALAHLADLTTLRIVALDENPLTGAGLRHLARSQQIYKLTLEQCPLTAQGMASFPQLANLKQLDTEQTTLTDSAIAGLPRLANLELWDLSQTSVTGAGFTRPERFPALDYLQLRRTNVNDAGVEHLAQLTALIDLSLQYTQVTDASIPALSKLAHLEELCLWGTAVTDAACRDLTQFSQLKSLGLQDTAVTDAGVEQFLHNQTLHELHVYNTQVTTAMIQRLEARRGVPLIVTP
jgi:internalin A